MSRPIDIAAFDVRDDDGGATILVLRPKVSLGPVEYRIPRQLVGNLIHQLEMQL